MASTVHVKNIASKTTKSEIEDFFSFCGKISNLSVNSAGDTQTASVSFEKPTAAKTALLLDNTQLGPNIVVVTSDSTLDELSHEKGDAGAAGEHHGGDVAQEDKPRSRIVAEYLAQGYTISDQAIQRAIALDSQHGISSRFTNALSQFDSKYKASEKAAGVDQKYGLSEKANAGWRSMSSYFEKAMGTPSGQRVHAFYQSTSKQVLDVHNEARRLADMKTADGKAAHAEKMNLHETAAGRTACNCGGAEGTCACKPGECACGSCAKNPEVASTADAKKMELHETTAGRTACNCGGAEGTCACKPGECACSSCGRNPDEPAKA